MTYLYLLLNLGSLSIPLLYSFHPKLKLYKHWKTISISIFITLLLFISWDIPFTQNGFWGFNDTYFIGATLFDLPIEEWLFFICIPYACIFTHFALLYYFPDLKFGSNKSTKSFTIVLIIALSILALLNYDKWYTLIISAYCAVLLIIALNDLELLKRYYITFLVMLIPFFLVNGVLTGSFITDEVVWYNNAENLGIRIFTIPIEDSIYAFSMILTSLLIMHKINNESLTK